MNDSPSSLILTLSGCDSACPINFVCEPVSDRTKVSEENQKRQRLRKLRGPRTEREQFARLEALDLDPGVRQSLPYHRSRTLSSEQSS